MYQGKGPGGTASTSCCFTCSPIKGLSTEAGAAPDRTIPSRRGGRHRAGCCPPLHNPTKPSKSAPHGLPAPDVEQHLWAMFWEKEAHLRTGVCLFPLAVKVGKG